MSHERYRLTRVVQASALPEGAAKDAVMERLRQAREASRLQLGFMALPPAPLGGLHCGCPPSAVVTDDAGVMVCGRCSEGM